jgi:hypothetical protein
LAAIPNRRRRLSDGVLVDASIRARVLGIRLLTIDATVVLGPAEVDAVSCAAHDPSQRTSARSSRHALADAVRSINEGADLLAEARRTDAWPG